MTQTGPLEIPPYSLRDLNRQVLLVRRPGGVPEKTDFALSTASVPEPQEGQILVRNIYLSVDPAQRGWASAEVNYSDPVPLGGVMRALAVGIVVSSRAEDFKEGDYLYGWFGWQDYSVVDGSKVLSRARAALPLSAFAGLLGINGLTAYLALTLVGRPEHGDTLLVSTAAGAVGSVVGQIGKILGCRTVGLTGDDLKVELCRYRYGYDAAFNYRETDIDQAIERAAPEGLNVFFDNTGGRILDSGLRHMAAGGRVVQCGTASVPSWSPTPTGPRNEREVLTRRLTWGGFVIFDHLSKFAEASEQLVTWHLDGKLTMETEIMDGIECAPEAIAALYLGANKGKRLIYIGD
ncbi:NADP-dependent oxidoreductase [Aquamicrobium sp.]|uniref:NADP-dependent oxidoreductase n=1 Tax=Aquamicrobium sp. TaxID=1872579 RepID=UPI002588744B|nr:NADP-dependent oxidoreductase [Aquamicrobium sp.]MCK9553226.1 NADP-dependent oxidoreductase [Aquamicrobium sp.]